MAHQHLQQLPPEIRHAALGNVGSIICFAPYLARELRPRFSELDLMNLENYHPYMTLMIEGVPSSPSVRGPCKPSNLAQMSQEGGAPYPLFGQFYCTTHLRRPRRLK